LSWVRRDPGRPLTSGERALAASLFGTAIDLDAVRLHRAKWFPFQPRNVAMAPDGGIWFHPQGNLWRDNFAIASEPLRALFIHELTKLRWHHSATPLSLVGDTPPLAIAHKAAVLLATQLRTLALSGGQGGQAKRSPKIEGSRQADH